LYRPKLGERNIEPLLKPEHRYQQRFFVTNNQSKKGGK
jgi:hypothetical protein